MMQIAVIGLGQIGGSLVLAIRKAALDAHIIGIDPSLRRRKLLAKHLSKSSTQWHPAHQADVIFLCLHFKLLQRFLNTTDSTALIVDVCSSKELVVRTANNRGLRMIGGHPMAGSERKAERGWNADLFQKAPFFLCPAGTATNADRIKLSRLLRKIGAQPVVVDPVKHDYAVSITSHLPALLARSYQIIARGIPTQFQGPGFHSFIRPGRCPDELLETFLQSNEKNIRKAAALFKRQLKRL